MPGSETQENKPPAGYPTETPTTGKKCFPHTKKKGDRGFIEGCANRTREKKSENIYK
ncbi:unnamed protein product [Dovyalis caffra]|uniref:Uncharacterized protein n=1 Tax=Dovyalis caffra TaxID=77055 RepID=A0AAV1RYR4_9ROSI|nr:unnamed protein product [Dovyalis caffra]